MNLVPGFCGSLRGAKRNTLSGPDHPYLQRVPVLPMQPHPRKMTADLRTVNQRGLGEKAFSSKAFCLSPISARKGPPTPWARECD